MKDYLRLIGIQTPDATEEQIRQAHFRTFRYFQGKKHNSISSEERREADSILEYLRRAQSYPDLPIPAHLRHYLPPELERATEVHPPAKPTVEQLKPDVFGRVASDLAQGIFGTTPSDHKAQALLPESVPPTDPQLQMPAGVEEPHPVEVVERTDEIELEPIFDIEPVPSQPVEVAPQPSPAQERALGAVISCPDCEWEILTDADSYCSGCGKSITNVAVPDELVIYIGDTGSYTKSFQIRNTGLIPISVGSFEVLEVEAKVQPAEGFVLAKGEAREVLLHVDEGSAFGRRSGVLRFRYHGKPRQLPISLKQPPDIHLQFLAVPNSRTTQEGFRLLIPSGTAQIGCCVETDSDKPLTISLITLSGDSRSEARTLLKGSFRLDREHKIDFPITIDGAGFKTLSISFEELGVRHFKLEIQCVQVANLTDRVSRYLIGEQSIILGSGIVEAYVELKNEPDGSLGYGIAERIELVGAPEWLRLEPQKVELLNSGDTALIKLLIDSSLIKSPGTEHVSLKIVYFDPQLECWVERPTALKLPFQFILPRQFDDWVAVDFGTSNTCAAILDGASFKTLELEPGMAESPTCIQFINILKQQWECGMKAYTKRFAGLRALNSTAWAFKPLLTQNPTPQTYLDIAEGYPHSKTVDELITIYIRALLDAVRFCNGIEPRRAVVTFPVTFGKKQRERLAEAFKAAGLEEVITPVSEPVALAISYAFNHQEILQRPGVFAVFDFGGGTTDLAIFRTDPGQDGRVLLKLLDIAGIGVGGEMLTFDLARYIYEQLVPEDERRLFSFPATFEELSSGRSDTMRENYSHLAADAEQIKRNLYTDRRLFEDDLQRSLTNGSFLKVFTTRLEFRQVEALLRARIDKAVKALLEMLDGLCSRGVLSERKLDWILLGGNSSKLQLVTGMLADAIFAGDQRQVLMDRENMKTGVMKGALLYAVSPSSLPFPIDEVRHTLPCHVGLMGAGYRFDPIFQRGLISGLEKPVQRRRVNLADQQQMRLYYYFGHETTPSVIDNPKMKPYAFNCQDFAGAEVDAEFTLLPEGEGIEIKLSLQGRELVHTAPLLGEG